MTAIRYALFNGHLSHGSPTRLSSALTRLGGALTAFVGALTRLGGALTRLDGALTRFGALTEIGGALTKLGGVLTRFDDALTAMGGDWTKPFSIMGACAFCIVKKYIFALFCQVHFPELGLSGYRFFMRNTRSRGPREKMF